MKAIDNPLPSSRRWANVLLLPNGCKRMLTHDEMIKRMLKKPAVKAEYDAQAEEFAFLDDRKTVQGSN